MIYDEENKYFIEHLLENLPNCIFWKDKNLVFKWCNESFAKQFGYNDVEDIIGKSDYDFPWSSDLRDKYIEDDKQILVTGRAKLNYEEQQKQSDGTVKTLLVSKTPVFDKNKNAIGILGIYADITEHKIIEKLVLENKLQETKIAGIKNFKKISEQVAHDIRSPLASLLMIIELCQNLPESERVSLRKISSSINDIANNLLNRYRDHENDINPDNSTTQHVLVPMFLTEILSEKKHQYKNSQIKFELSQGKMDSFIFIEVNLLNFKRMMSNLINNSVEAVEDKEGMVNIEIQTNTEQVRIIVQDNGKGMPQNIIDKITNKISITSGKKNGCGIGFAQIKDTLQDNNGKMLIESKVGIGTKITLTFPRMNPPNWIAKQIDLHKNDIVIVLDDDPSIHEAWEAKFKPYKSIIKLKHFKLGKEAVKFINELTSKEKNKVFLLSDFELIGQNLDGVKVINNLNLQHRSILVTSHYENENVRNLAANAGIKVLPKQLALNISIEVTNENDNNEITSSKKADLVIIDDDQLLANSLVDFFKNKYLIVDVYYTPEDFLEVLPQYAKNTKICMDDNLHANISGIQLAKKLNKLGYTNLYLFSGKDFEANEVPNYLTAITKGDVAALNKLAQ